MENTIKAEPLPMDVDLTDVKTSYPVLQAGVYRATVSGAEVVRDEDDEPKGYSVAFRLNQTARSTGGEEINPGLIVRQYITLRPSLKNPEWDWKSNRDKALARIKKAATGSQAGGWNVEEVIGKEVAIKVKVSERDGEELNDVVNVYSVEN